MEKTIVWFRQDLRLNDNPALKAASDNSTVIPVYIHDTHLDERYRPGSASRWWLHHALNDLADALDNRLIVLSGNPLTLLKELACEYSVDRICWNRLYEEWSRERDKNIKESLKSAGFAVSSFNGSLLWEPMDISKKDGGPYKVYTPYYRNGCLNAESPRYPLERADVSVLTTIDQNAKQQIDDLSLLPQEDWDEGLAKMWTPSERAAQQNLQLFINRSIKAYNEKRDIPSERGTSELSPYFHFGQLSPNQAWYAIHDAFNGNTSGKGVDTYLSELGWREFSYHLLFHFDNITEKNYNDKFDAFPWRTSNEDLKAWQKGNTGIPIIDAGMRQLWQTGWMHNRIRMVVGSFLVKNLLIDWRLGERWFWDCLVDADSASNAAGWQWVAGSGADAAPYFRVFNPVLQGEKFDKQGDYVRKYCPELSALPNKFIHKPWEASEDILKDAGIALGVDYPKPLVDLKESRQRALDAYDKVKGK